MNSAAGPSYNAKQSDAKQSGGALIYRRWGGPGELSWEGSFPPGRLPAIPPGFLRVRVAAISVNPVDWKIMKGEQKLLTGKNFPRIFGSDFSGRVIESGPASGYKPGDRVAGMISPLHSGSGQREVWLPALHCIPVPDDMTLEDAAGLPAAGISAILASGFADHKVTGSALVIGAAGGVGSLAVQILLKRGWDVHAVAREGRQRSVLESLGCSNFISREAWEDELRGGSWDAIIDAPGVLHKKHPRRLLASGGWYAPVYVPNSLIISNFLSRPLWWMTNRHRSLFLAAPSGRRMTRLRELIESRVIRPVTDSVWPAEQAREAISHAMDGPLTGKVIITLPGD